MKLFTVEHSTTEARWLNKEKPTWKPEHFEWLSRAMEKTTLPLWPPPFARSHLTHIAIEKLNLLDLLFWVVLWKIFTGFLGIENLFFHFQKNFVFFYLSTRRIACFSISHRVFIWFSHFSRLQSLRILLMVMKSTMNRRTQIAIVLGVIHQVSGKFWCMKILLDLIWMKMKCKNEEKL